MKTRDAVTCVYLCPNAKFLVKKFDVLYTLEHIYCT